MTVSISALPELAKNEVHPVIVDSYGEVTPTYPLIGTQITEDMLSAAPYGHKSRTLLGMGLPVHRRDGEEIQSDAFGDGYPWQMGIKMYDNKVEIPLRALEKMESRGVTQTLIAGVKMWGRSFMEMKEDLMAQPFNSGGLTAGSTAVFDQTFEDGSQADPYPAVIYDGESFFGTAHPQKSDTSVTYSNVLAGSALSASTFNNALVRISSANAKDDRGRRINNDPEILLVSPTLQATARQVLLSAGYPGTGNNDINPNQGVVNLVTWRALSDNSGAAWYLGKRSSVVYYDSGAPVFDAFVDKSRKVLVMTAGIRFGRAVSDWRGWVGANVSTS